MAKRTPPTAAIRQAWIGAHPFRTTTTVEEREAEFDRWLAEVRQDEAERIAAWVTADEPSDTLVLLADALRRGDHRG